MFFNYFKLAIRLMVRNPFFNLINVVGLSLGFAVFFILWPFTQAELRSDQFATDHQKIFRILFEYRWVNQNGSEEASTGITQPSFLVNQVALENQIADYTRFIPQDYLWPTNSPGLKAYLVIGINESQPNSSLLKVENAICADQNLFEFFDIPFAAGNRAKALEQTKSIVLSEAMKVKLFGDHSAIGEIVKVNGLPFQVTGVFKNLPVNSHLQFDVVFSNASKLQVWNDVNASLPLFCFNYCKTLNEKDNLLDFLNKSKAKQIGTNLFPNIKIAFSTQRLSEIVFQSFPTDDRFVVKSKFTLRMLSAISVLVLLMAWMNYVNLTISRTKTRFKEMAARKVSGAAVRDLFLQFFCQSLFINFLAALMGITIIQLLKQPFHEFLNIYIEPVNGYDVSIMIFFGFVFTVGVLVTSLYPAWITSRFTLRQLIIYNPVNQKRVLPSVLTTFQYISALVLIALILINHAQLQFILSKSIGINKENVVVIEAPIVGLEEDGVSKMKRFAEQFETKLATDVTLSGRVPGDFAYNVIIKKWGSDIVYGFDTYGGTDENFLALYGLDLLAGRNFQRDETSAVILLSESATKRMGYGTPEAAIGAIVEVNNYDEPYSKAEIIGVFRDYRVLPYLTTENTEQDADGRGQCFAYLNNVWKDDLPERLSATVRPEQLEDFLQTAQKLYAAAFPENVFTWYFVDDYVNRHYQQQKVLRNQISFFTVLAVGVACLGLLGMVANKVADKTKEISIRKILGAHSLHIIAVLLSSALKQVLFSIIIGIPVAWKLSEEFLVRYSERIKLQWWHYGVPVVILLGIMLLTIATLIWSAARKNPVDALKCE